MPRNKTRRCKVHGELSLGNFYIYTRSKPDRKKPTTEYRCKLCWKSPKIRRRYKRYSADLRLEALTHYSSGKPSCECCGEIRIEFLALDHKDGGGNKHRKEIKNDGNNIYRWVRRNGFPPIFRVLCHNCNSSYGHYGYCPHQKEHNVRNGDS